MDEQQVKYDEFGIPIKQVQKQEVDEFGIPIKKKDLPEVSLSDAETSTTPVVEEQKTTEPITSSPYLFPDFSKLKNDLKIPFAPKDEKELLDAEVETGNKQKDEDGLSISQKFMLSPDVNMAIGSIIEPYLTRVVTGLNIGSAEILKTFGSMIRTPDKTALKLYRSLLGDDITNNIINTANEYSNKVGLGDLYDVKSDKEAEPTGVFKRAMESSIENNEALDQEAKDRGADNFVGNVVNNTAKIGLDIAASSMLPEVKIAQLAKYGITHIPKFPVYLGMKTSISEDSGIAGFAKGWLEGTAYETIGLVSGALGKSVGKTVQKSIEKSGGSQLEALQKGLIPEATTRILANATLFGGYDAANQLLATGEVDTDVLAESIGVALALSGRDITGTAKQNKQLIREQFEKRKAASLLTASYDQMANISQNPVDISNLRQESIRLGNTIDKETNVQIQAENTLKKNLIDNTILLNAKINDVVMFPEEHIKSVQNDPSMSASEKNYTIDKINKVIDTNDPVIIRINDLAKQVDPIEQEIEFINNSELSQASKTLQINGKQAKIKDIQSKINELNTEPKYFIGDKEVSSTDELLTEYQKVYQETGNTPKVRVSNDIEGKDKVVQGIEEIINTTNDKLTEVKTTPEPTTEVNVEDIAENKDLITAKEETIKTENNDISNIANPNLKGIGDRVQQSEKEGKLSEQILQEDNNVNYVFRNASKSEVEDILNKEGTTGDFWRSEPNEYKNYGDYLIIKKTPNLKEYGRNFSKGSTIENDGFNYVGEKVTKENIDLIIDKNTGDIIYDNNKELLDKIKSETKLNEQTQRTNEVKQEEVNKEKEIIGDNKTDKERTLAFSASLDEISQSFDVPDLSREKQKAASDRLVSFVKDNAPRFENVKPSLVKHLVEEASKVTSTNKTYKIKYIKKVLENSEFANKIDEINTERKNLNWNKIKDSAKDFKHIKDAVFKARLTNKGKKLTTWLNKIDMSKLDEDLNMVNEYSEVLKGLNRKGVPDFTTLKPFMDKYREVIQTTIDENIAKDLDKFINEAGENKLEEAIVNKSKALQETINNLNNGIDLTPENFISAKRQASALLNRMNSLINNGIMSVENGEFISNSPEYKNLEEFVNAEIPNLPKYKEQIAKAEEVYKTNTLGEITKLSTEYKGETFSSEDSKLIAEIERNSKDVLKSKDAIEALTPYDVEYLRQSIEQVNESGIFPTATYKYAEKLSTAKLYGDTKVDVFDALLSKSDYDKVVNDILTKKTQEDISRALTVPEWNKGEVLHLVTTAGKLTQNKLFTTLSAPSIEQINLSSINSSKAMENVNKALADIQKGETNLGKISGKIFGVTGKSDKSRIASSRVGILMSGLRFYHLIESGKNIVKKGDIINVIDINGKAVLDEQGVVIKFNTAAEAKDWIKTNKAKVIGEDNLDLFNLVNYGSSKSKREQAKFGGSDAVKNEELGIFDEAYKSLSNDGNKIVVTTDAEALSYLTPKEQTYYKSLRKLFLETQDMASTIAAREGKTLDKEEFYYPMQSKSMNNAINTDSFVEQNIFGTDYKAGSLPQVAGYINPKTKAINYIDFDSYRVTDKYINEMMVSNYVLPTARIQIDALNKLIKKYASGEKDNEKIQGLERFARALKDDIALGYQVNYNNKGIGFNLKIPTGKSSYINISDGYRKLVGYGRNIMMQTGYRIPLDAAPNSINLGINPLKAFGLKSSKEKADWRTFFAENQETMPAQKIEEFTVKGSLGFNEAKPVEKGILKEYADKNITLGDAATSIEAWIKYFNSNYKELTGQEFDVTRYNGEQSFKDQVQYDPNFIEAKRLAQYKVTRTITPQTGFEGKRFLGRVFYGAEPFKKGNWAFNWASPLTMYSQNQAARFWQNVHNMYYNSNEGRSAAAFDLSKQFSGEMAYALMAQGGLMFTKYIASVLSGEDDKKAYYEEQVKKLYTDPTSYLTSLVGSSASLMIGGYGNLGRLLIGTGYVVIGDEIANSKDAPSRAKWLYAKKDYDTYVSRFANTKFNITSEYGKMADFASLALPVTGLAGTRIFNEIGSLYHESALGAQEMLSDNSKKNFNAANFANSLNYLTALRWITPISRDIDTYTKEMARDYGTYMRTEDAAFSQFVHNDFSLLYDEANEIRKTAEQEEYGSGSDQMKTYLDRNSGEYRKRYSYYMVNKSNIRPIDTYIRAIEKAKIPFEEKKQLWEKVRMYTEEMKSTYDKVSEQESVETSDLIWIPSGDAMKLRVDIQMALMKHFQEETLKKTDVKNTEAYNQLEALRALSKPKEE